VGYVGYIGWKSIRHRAVKGEQEMNTERLKWLLLAVFLILEGLILLGVHIGGNLITLIAGLCAVVAGILFLINR
jgi:hypothetical protein